MSTTDTPFTADQVFTEDLAKKFLDNGRTMQDFTALTPESMEVIYMLAYNLYNGAKFQEAERIFKLLSHLNHFERKYWKGLGACREGLKHYEAALQAYGYLGMMDPHDPEPAFQAAKCFLALGKSAEAEAGLRAAIFNTAGKPDQAELNQKATALLEIVLQARQTKPATVQS